MKILHVTPYYKPFVAYGGPVVSISGLCEGLAAIGHEVVVVTTYPKDGKNYSNLPGNINGVKVLYFQNAIGGNVFFSPALFKWLWKNGSSFPLIHIHTWWDMVAVLSLLILKMKNRKVVFSPRGMLSTYSFEHRNQFLKKSFNNLLGRLLFKSTILHATSRQELTECLSIRSGWRNFVLPNFVELSDTRVTHSTPSDRLELIFLSRIDAKKGLPLLFEALSEVPFDFILKIAGSGEEKYMQELRETAIRSNIDKKVKWSGWLNGDQKFQALSKADVFVLTSYNENFANVVVEALSVGTAVVLTKGVGLSEYVIDNKLGWVADHDAEDIRRALIDSFAGKSIRNDVRDRAPSLAREDFSGSKLATSYLHAYENILSDAY